MTLSCRAEEVYVPAVAPTIAPATKRENILLSSTTATSQQSLTFFVLRQGERWDARYCELVKLGDGLVL
jgi:hypothetical protein